MIHALWSCRELDVVWANEDLWNFLTGMHFLNVKELVNGNVDSVEKKKPRFICNDCVVDMEPTWLCSPLTTSWAFHLFARASKDRLAEFLVLQ